MSRANRNTKLRELQQTANTNGGVCGKCTRKTDYLTVDHIVPYSFIFGLGLQEESQNHDWNFQLLCRPCNVLKGAKWDFTDPRTIQNLKRYVELTEQYYSQ